MSSFCVDKSNQNFSDATVVQVDFWNKMMFMASMCLGCLIAPHDRNHSLKIVLGARTRGIGKYDHVKLKIAYWRGNVLFTSSFLSKKLDVEMAGKFVNVYKTSHRDENLK
ncbi:hypothetical protein FRACYDRAFT_235502 [Fragilariopsis cylindrus CCMP1102]|uniref:Uncharacterized protein n=1 Tax=Fragilariopsis cylindrus CCMP1102 TaxID=635003 RepID=A0A1E7FMP8_9STRA|nr:hypothetical protein FRACYDRAFT_235502 [Fragilariopsis cylindrus CCMP1102]|eukprot:OEU19448.1 hypothetical protein FRACYDRAFT_235502 [Fragilariopsis cylindrus CCMP1102]